MIKSIEQLEDEILYYENSIATSSMVSYMYSIEVLNTRFLLGERAISWSRIYSQGYVLHFFNENNIFNGATIAWTEIWRDIFEYMTGYKVPFSNKHIIHKFKNA